MRRKFAGGAGVLLIGLLLTTASAQGSISASATISSQQVGIDSYDYSLTLTNTGNTAISTYWFGWLPLYDLLPSHPVSIESPFGWSAIDAADYFGVASIQWTTTTNALQPGQSLSGFNFNSADSPGMIEGPSSFGPPVTQSYVYIGAPEFDPGFPLTAAVAAPEPSAAALLAGTAGWLAVRRKGIRGRAMSI